MTEKGLGEKPIKKSWKVTERTLAKLEPAIINDQERLGSQEAIEQAKVVNIYEGTAYM